MQFIKKHFVLIIAFALPVLVIIGVALSVSLPYFLLSTKYDFVYATCDNRGVYYEPAYMCQNYVRRLYSVRNGTLTVNTIDPTLDSDNDDIADVDENYMVRIFLHDTEKNESREITLAEAQSVSLNDLLTSPDGVTISSGYNRGGGFLFIDSGYASYGQYLVKGNSRTRLNVVYNPNDYYSTDNFYFIGWVIPGRN